MSVLLIKILMAYTSWTRMEREVLLPTMAGRRLLFILKMLNLPHKEIHSFKLTKLRLSLSSSLSLAKYFHQHAHNNCGLGATIDNNG